MVRRTEELSSRNIPRRESSEWVPQGTVTEEILSACRGIAERRTIWDVVYGGCRARSERVRTGARRMEECSEEGRGDAGEGGIFSRTRNGLKEESWGLVAGISGTVEARTGGKA